MTRKFLNPIVWICCLVVSGCTSAQFPPPTAAFIAAPNQAENPVEDNPVDGSVVGLYRRSWLPAQQLGINYGLYTYVLLGRDHDQNAALLLALLPGSTSAAIPDSQDVPSLNLIAIPLEEKSDVKSHRRNLRDAQGEPSVKQAAVIENILHDYDVDWANAKRLKICRYLRNYTPAEHAALRGDVLGLAVAACRQTASGPMMLTVRQPLDFTQNQLPSPFLIFDFTSHETAYYGHWTEAYMQQVTRRDITDGRNVNDFGATLAEWAWKNNRDAEKVVDTVKSWLIVSK